MVIDAFNCNIINSRDVYIHDDIFKKLEYDYNCGVLTLELESVQSSTRRPYVICFQNVLGFNMTACDFWGRSLNIFDWIYVEKSQETLIPALQEEKTKNAYIFTKLDKNIEYFETAFYFTSGDMLIVACSCILFPDDMYRTPGE